MSITKNKAQKQQQFGLVTRILAGRCHKCRICLYADRRPDSAFGKLIRWHRTWCPAWAAHTKVYGEKSLSR
jgi:hypothetical protein